MHFNHSLEIKKKNILLGIILCCSFDPSTPPVFVGKTSYSPALPVASLYDQEAFWALMQVSHHALILTPIHTLNIVMHCSVMMITRMTMRVMSDCMMSDDDAFVCW
jgi:hypothetical protein